MNVHAIFAQRRGGPRQASILVCVLVCLAIATSLIGSTVRTALDARRAMRTQLQLRQTELLLAAGIQRARWQLQEAADNPAADYVGEAWQLPPQVIPNVESAYVKIDITPANPTSLRKVDVTARLSVAASRTLQRSISFTIDLKKESAHEVANKESEDIRR